MAYTTKHACNHRPRRANKRRGITHARTQCVAGRERTCAKAGARHCRADRDGGDDRLHEQGAYAVPGSITTRTELERCQACEWVTKPVHDAGDDGAGGTGERAPLAGIDGRGTPLAGEPHRRRVTTDRRLAAQTHRRLVSAVRYILHPSRIFAPPMPLSLTPPEVPPTNDVTHAIPAVNKPVSCIPLNRTDAGWHASCGGPKLAVSPTSACWSEHSSQGEKLALTPAGRPPKAGAI
jgi:hypothetical protein